MRVPLSWLRDYVAVELEPAALAERLTLLGMEVKGIETIGAEWRSVVVGELLEVGPHPGSNRLSLTKVKVGDGTPSLSIVCGARNIAVGQKVPVALPGSVLPGDRRIEVTRIAGEESQGMLCSGDELGVTSDAEGILILPPDTAVGRPVADVLGDVVLDVDVKPNRGDALCMVGLAREVAAATGAPLRWPDITVPESGDATTDHVSVDVQDRARCTRFVARYLDGVRIEPSPFDIQRRLLLAGMRPISNVVDASNYVMLELGKPVHTFDAATLRDGHIIVRGALAGERLETLDHVMRDLDPEVLLIAGEAGPLGLAGVMGGAASEVSGSTTAIVVESAIFDPVSIRRTAFRYALRSEASLRFEKGQESRLARIGADRTAQLILRWAGGRAATGVVDTAPQDPPPATLAFRPARVSRSLGIDIDASEQAELLERVGIGTVPAGPGAQVPVIAADLTVPVTEPGTALLATIPSHRRDLLIEADIAEEVARIRGYETQPGRLPDTVMPAYRDDPWRLTDQLRTLLSGRGLSEVVTHGLVGPEDHTRLGLGVDDPATIRTLNPVSVDHSELRRSLLPGHLRVLRDNERQRRMDVAIFETGPLHRQTPEGPTETDVLGVLATGTAAPADWQAPPRGLDIGDVKGLLEWLVERIGGAHLRYEPVPARPGVDHPGRTAAVVTDLPSGQRMVMGRVGELDPRYLASCDVRAERVLFAELELDGIRRLLPDARRVDTLERAPAVERDIAVVVGHDRPATNVESIIREVAGPLLSSARLFDRYQGEPLSPHEVSLGWRLRFQPVERPLEEAELEELVQRIITALRQRLGARLRA